MQRIIWLALIAGILVPQSTYAEVPALNTVILSTQTEVDEFIHDHPVEVRIYDDLTIQYDVNNPTMDPIQDLTGMPRMTKIGGDLVIKGHQNDLNHFQGLESIQVVVGDVIIEHCSQIIGFRGLGGLREIGGEFKISQNGRVRGLNEFDRLKSAGELTVVNNVALKEMRGFRNLEQISVDFRLIGNNALTTISGFTRLHTVGRSLWFENNRTLQELGGFRALRKIGTSLGALNLVNLPKLIDLSGFNYLQEIRGNIHINRCDELVDINALMNVQIGNCLVFGITNNPRLSNCRGLKQLASQLSNSTTVSVHSNGSQNCNL